MELAEEAHRRAEFEHGAAQEALATAGEACKKAEEENGHLADEKLALVIKLGALNDDFAAFREKASADRESMEAEFDSSGDTLFNYGYGYCAFTYNICGSKPLIPDGMSSPSVPLTTAFFANPRCPLGASAATFAWDLIAVSGENCSENSPTAAGEEAVLPTDFPTEFKFFIEAKLVLFSVAAPNNLLFFLVFWLFWVFWHYSIWISTCFYLMFLLSIYTTGRVYL